MRPNQSHRHLHSKGDHKNKWKDNLQNGRKYLKIIDVTDKGLISNICNRKTSPCGKKVPEKRMRKQKNLGWPRLTLPFYANT